MSCGVPTWVLEHACELCATVRRTVWYCPVSVRTVRSLVGHFGHCSRAWYYPICVRSCPVMSGHCPVTVRFGVRYCPIKHVRWCPACPVLSGVVSEMSGQGSGLTLDCAVCMSANGPGTSCGTCITLGVMNGNLRRVHGRRQSHIHSRT